MGVKISKRNSSYSYGSFLTNLFLKFPVTALTKVAYRNVLKFRILKKIEIFFSVGPYGSENLKNATPPAVMNLFQPNFF